MRGRGFHSPAKHKQVAVSDGTTKNDLIFGSQARDTISGHEGNDFLAGKKARDDLFGNDDNDTLIGGRGGDRLNGGVGDDNLVGGKGADVFILNGGFDTIADFSNRDDTLAIDTRAYFADKPEGMISFLLYDAETGLLSLRRDRYDEGSEVIEIGQTAPELHFGGIQHGGNYLLFLA